MLTSMNTLFNISTYETNEAKLLENIRNDWSFMVNLDKIYNSNGTWIVDLLKWSWANIKCRIQWDGTFLLEWDNWSVAWNDGIDDNCNSDNYMTNSTGWVSYPDNFEDDDVKWRKELSWYISKKNWFKNIFFNTEKYKNIIENNTNNNDLLNSKIWTVDEWYLYLDIDKNIELKILEFDKTIYNNSKELILLNTYNSSISSWSWFISIDILNKLNLWTLFSINFKFDFKNKLYAIFVKNMEKNALLYNLKGETVSWTWIYIVPIDDSKEKEIEFLGSEIIITENNTLISKEKKIIYKK
jgi:hypothetical protein